MCSPIRSGSSYAEKVCEASGWWLGRTALDVSVRSKAHSPASLPFTPAFAKRTRTEKLCMTRCEYADKSALTKMRMSKVMVNVPWTAVCAALRCFWPSRKCTVAPSAPGESGSLPAPTQMGGGSGGGIGGEGGCGGACM